MRELESDFDRAIKQLEGQRPIVRSRACIG